MFAGFKYFCVVHCVTEHVADVFLVSFFFLPDRLLVVANYGRCHAFQCSGDSMEPSVRSGDLVIVQRFSRAFNGVDRGDVVIAKSPAECERFILKRVKAVDGQTVKRGMHFRTVGVDRHALSLLTIILLYEHVIRIGIQNGVELIRAVFESN